MKFHNINLPKCFSVDLAEEIGLHLGDGSMNFYNGKGFYQLRGHIIDDKEHYITRIKPLYKKLFNLDVNLKDMHSSGVFGFQIWSNKLVGYKSKVLGLPLGKKLDFMIPSFIIKDKTLLKCFLRGYFDTDGCLYIENKRGKPYPRVEMTTISKRFAKQLKDIINKLSFRVSCYVEKREKYGWHDLHKIVIRGNVMTKKWFSEIKPQNPKHIKKFKLVDRV